MYLYGLDIIAQQQAERYYYVHGGLGSVRHPSTGLRAGLVDTTGQIETDYAYDPFGVPVFGGAGYNPYQYTGEAWDAEVGLLYLRARYYQPEVGRFTTDDPWDGDIWRPSTLNKYSYARSSPVTRTDPEGLNGHGPEPLCPECQEALPGYSVFEATLSGLLLVEGWFNERWWIPQELHFGPEAPLTQAVMRSPALFQFRAEWAKQGYQVPWHMENQSYEERDKGPLPQRLVGGAVSYAYHNLRLVILGDPVGATLGSFNEIGVHESQLGAGMVHFEAYNVMGWASATRIYGTRIHLHNVPRDALGPGGTIEQWFEWEEPMPTGCFVRFYQHLLRERFNGF